MSAKTFNLTRFYFAIVSIIWLVGTVVWYWTLAYQLLSFNLISTDEYVRWTYDYRIQSCEDNNTAYAKPVSTTETTDGLTGTQKTPEEIQTCKDKAYEEISFQRSYNLKNDMIWGWVWWSLFAIVFLLHFPFFIRKEKEE